MRLDEELSKFASRRLETEYPYLILDARYGKVRVDGVKAGQDLSEPVRERLAELEEKAKAEGREAWGF